MKHVLRLFALLFFTHSAFATHYLGGEITWQCIDSGPNAGKFKFYVILYRECGTGASTYLPNPVVLTTNAPSGSITCNMVGSGVDVSPNCYLDNTPTGSPISCGNVTSGEGAVWEQRYESGYITISGTPPPTGWYFSFTDCCRPAITNLSGGSGNSYTLRAYMYPYTPQGSTTPLSAYPCYDSSPRFLEAPKTVICTGYDYTYAHNAFDDDLDTMIYNWAYPQTTAIGANPGYTGTYTFNNPLPSSNGVNLDPSTGAISFTPNIQGSFATCVEVTAERCGQVVSKVYRDIPIILTSCSGTNLPPTYQMAVDTTVYPPLTPIYNSSGKLLYWEANVFAGQEVKFNMVAQDPQLNPNNALQSVEFSASGGQLGGPVAGVPYANSNSGCLNPPCATLTSQNLNGTFTAVTNNEVQFNWVTNCSHLSYVNSNCGTSTNKYVFSLRMQDDFCPAPAISVGTVVINVRSSIPVPPDLAQSCGALQPDGSVAFDYLAPSDTGMNFDSYIVYRGSSPNIPFTSIATINNFGTALSSLNSFTDPSPMPGTNYYYMRTAGGCGLLSAPSDTILVMDLNLNKVNTSIAELTWTPSNLQNSTYEVWRSTLSSGPTSWNLLFTTPDTFFVDNVDFCVDSAFYQIRVNGGCHSRIAKELLGKIDNYELIEIDSVSVLGSNTYISWSQGTTPGIQEYYLMEPSNIAGVYNYLDTIIPPFSSPIKINGSSPDSRIGRYVIMSKDECGFNSDVSVLHNNILLTENMDPCEGYMRLRWNSYKGWPDGVQEYQIWRTQTPLVGGVSQDQLIGTNNPLDTFFVDRSLMGGFSYCYKIRAIDGSITKSSTSNSVCINSLAVQRSRLLYLAKTSVRNDNAVELVTFIDKDADIIHFDLQRADREGAPFTSLGLIPKPVSPPWEIRFKDFSADPNNHRYQYRFVATDSCGGIDTASNIGTNILLEIQPVDNLTNILTWNPYQEFMGGVLKYDIYRSVGENGGMSFVGTTTDTIFTDNISPLGDNVGIFCYKVVATEGPSPLMFTDYDGSVFTSTSNVVCAEHNPRVFIPNSFNPNSDIQENRTWRPKQVYVESGTYLLEIFDRWGNKVFSTTDEMKGWDGTIGGTKAAEGSYIYQMIYRSKQGEPVELRGTLLLIY